MRRWHRLVLALYRIDLLLRIGYRRSSTTRASKTVRQLAPSDGEVAVVTPPSPQLPPSMVRLTALVIRSPVMLSPATVRKQRFSSVRVPLVGLQQHLGRRRHQHHCHHKEKGRRARYDSKDDHPCAVRPVAAFGDGSL